MTVLGKTIITTGIVILTVSSIVWILTANWQWFAGGGVVFLGSIMAGVIISVETKDGNHRSGGRLSHSSYHQPPHIQDRDRDQDTRPIPDDNWTPPTTPPPDSGVGGGNGGDGGDAFFNPPR